MGEGLVEGAAHGEGVVGVEVPGAGEGLVLVAVVAVDVVVELFPGEDVEVVLVGAGGLEGWDDFHWMLMTVGVRVSCQVAGRGLGVWAMPLHW